MIVINRKTLIKKISHRSLSLVLYVCVFFIPPLFLIISPSLLNLLLFLILFIVSITSLLFTIINLNQSIWQVINLSIAMLILTISFLQFFIEVNSKNDPTLFFLIILGFVSIIIGYFSEGNKWKQKLIEWNNNQKIDFQNNRLNILVPWYIPDIKKSRKLTIISSIGIGSSLIWIKWLTNEGTNYTVLGIIMGVFSLIPIYVLGRFLKRIVWILSCQTKNKVMFYNELGESYSIKEFFAKRSKKE